jgi:hypothetical protein
LHRQSACAPSELRRDSLRTLTHRTISLGLAEPKLA